MSGGRSGFLYHLLMGIGFLFLLGAFYLMQHLGFNAWVVEQGPASHRGALQLLAVMIWMTPAFLIWKYYVRYINRRLKIEGIYYEDSYYGRDADANADKDSKRDE